MHSRYTEFLQQNIIRRRPTPDMTNTGTRTLAQLREALVAARHRAAEQRQRRATIDERSRGLAEERSHAIVELARHYLPDMQRETIAQTCSDIRTELVGIVDRRERQLDVLAGQRQRLVTERDRLQADYKTLIEKLVAARKERQQVEQEVTQALAVDEEFQELSRKAMATEAELLRDEQRVAQIQHDAGEKLPAYQNSRLFQYLYRRGLGTPAYSSRGFTRRLDRWVGGLIDYHKARGSYEFLQRTPELMQLELQRRQASFNDMMELVENIRNDTAMSHGLPQKSEVVEELKSKRDQQQQGLAAAEERCERSAAEIASLQSSEDRFYEEALARYQRYLDTTETTLLADRAAKTPDAADDEIVSRIRFLNDELQRAQSEQQQVQTDVKTADKHCDGLDFVTRRFEQMGMTNERGQFRAGFDIQQPLAQFEEGVIDQQQLLAEIREHFIIEPGWAEKAASGATDVFSHPLTRTLVGALVQIGGEAIRYQAERSVRRRSRRR